MSLITRCPACETLFRVVPDQLRISEGWVRCGQCAEIFDASQQLQALATAPAPAGPSVPEQGPSLPPAAPVTEDPLPAPEAKAPQEFSGEAEEPAPPLSPPVPDEFADTLLSENPTPPPVPAVLPPEPVEPAQTATASPPVAVDGLTEATAALGTDATDHSFVEGHDPEDEAGNRPLASPLQDDASAAALTDPTSAIEPEVDPQTLPAAPDEAPVSAASPPVEAAAAPAEDTPAHQPAFPPLRLPTEPVEIAASEAPPPTAVPLSFMRPQRAASTLWQRPAMRATLGTVAGLLVVLLLVQVLLQQRDRIAAQAPDTRPLLATLCGWVGCTVSPLRQIESIVIDGSSFGRIRDNQYRLTLGIRNTAAFPLQMPALELSLTNSQAQTLSRRVIQTQEFPGAPAVLAPGAEWNGALTLRVAPSTGVQDVAGYGLFAFYP